MLNSLPFKVATSEFKTGFLCPPEMFLYPLQSAERGGRRVEGGTETGQVFRGAGTEAFRDFCHLKLQILWLPWSYETKFLP